MPTAQSSDLGTTPDDMLTATTLTPTQASSTTTLVPTQGSSKTTLTPTQVSTLILETLDDLGGFSLPVPTPSPSLSRHMSLSPSRCASPSPSHHAMFVDPPASQAQRGWTPHHKPSWVLGPQHRSYVHSATPYLIGVPGGFGWENLLARYIVFESLSSARSVSLFIDLCVHCLLML